MKINKAKKKKRTESSGDDSDKDLARMRSKFKKNKDREEGTEESRTTDTLKEGSNPRRFLPRKGTREFYIEVWVHFNVGPTSQRVRCPGTFNEKGYINANTPCPICRNFLVEQQRINKKYKRGSEEGKEAYFKIKDAYHPKQRYLANVLREDGEIKVLEYGEQISGQLLEHWFEDGSKVGDFTDISDGRWMNIKRKGTDRKTTYKVIPDDETAELEDWKILRKKLHDLEAAAGEVMKPKDIKALMEGDFEDDDEEDEDAASDDGSEEDEEESFSKRRRKSRDNDDSDDDDDDSDDDDDDGDDESDEDDESEEDDEDSEDESEEDEDDEDEDDEPVKRRSKNKKRR